MEEVCVEDERVAGYLESSCTRCGRSAIACSVGPQVRQLRKPNKDKAARAAVRWYVDVTWVSMLPL